MTHVARQQAADDAGYRDDERERIIREFAPVIKCMAHRLAYRLPAHLDADDLISVGIMGLMDALGKYDPTRAAKFKTYAEFRIRGAMLDEIRSMDWVPRSVHERIDLLQKTQRQLLNRYGRPPTEDELAAALKQPVEELADFLSRAQGAVMISLDDVGAQEADEHRILSMLIDTEHPDPLSTVIAGDVRRLLSKAIQQLAEKERLVLTLYYYEELTMKEIGRILNVTESRVCQIHTKAVLFLKSRLQGVH
ncbi:MAG: FliA/WhiG family RNA polymerase sigma factor [Nitrospiraceae bacterium]